MFLTASQHFFVTEKKQFKATFHLNKQEVCEVCETIYQIHNHIFSAFEHNVFITARASLWGRQYTFYIRKHNNYNLH